MKKIYIGLLAILAICLSLRLYISSNGEKYFQKFIDSENRGLNKIAVFKIKDFHNSILGANTEIAINTPNRDNIFKNPIILDTNISYGPFILDRYEFGLMGWKASFYLRDIFKKSLQNNIDAYLKNPVHIIYSAKMGFGNNINETIDISSIDILKKKIARLNIYPIRLKGNYNLDTFKGEWHIDTKEFFLNNLEAKYMLELKDIDTNWSISDIKPILFGRYSFSSKKISLKTANIQKPLNLKIHIDSSLEKESNKSANLSINLLSKNLDRYTEEYFRGIKKADINISCKNIGIRGVEELKRLVKDRKKIQNELTKAIATDNDLELQKAILALQELENRWVKIYNTLLIPNKTKLHIDTTLTVDKQSHILIDLLYRGKALDGDFMNALITLGANAQNIVSGKFSLDLEDKLIKNIYPNAIFIFDSMANKNLATFKDGIYHIEGKISNGKIIINNTKYAPQELIMMILM